VVGWWGGGVAPVITRETKAMHTSTHMRFHLLLDCTGAGYVRRPGRKTPGHFLQSPQTVKCQTRDSTLSYRPWGMRLISRLHRSTRSNHLRTSVACISSFKNVLLSSARSLFTRLWTASVSHSFSSVCIRRSSACKRWPWAARSISQLRVLPLP
jgi:hypothetical protein